MAEAFLDENQDTGWIIDGNYAKFCQERRLEEADLIVFMDYTRRICLWQAVNGIWSTEIKPGRAWPKAAVRRLTGTS